ncbi:SIR2 family NAD-dependent protein deacylase [Deinococcus cellulosilyticus]|uniref:NAD-dependent protein deacylase n=1 Tax=Deinococcus cellulosilyticus (strain DSM 18568 / NBRC 106333 / KACC 11606 / 5516J-15) TaxID=1223518 RepID=A0A511MYU7_DEIC1|nr:NAD-dependent deacylase [Deinococcus cellulosilyticus]GEM45770.1 NAD-dependent protein deacylase [Deinococcus cellulosilyticus NBRC 106333 = KACC 11606]
MANIVVLTGAGISAESGLKTFRDLGGLWETHSVEDLASPAGFRKNPQLVLDFYNLRRKQALEAQPNAAHLALAELEKKHHVQIITQNVDDLHERAGSSKVLHLHGELRKVRSTQDASLIYDIDEIDPENLEIHVGCTCEKGSQLRPHIVWFGEMVPEIEKAAELCRTADFFLVVGTSLMVFPAAALIHEVPAATRKCIIDPNLPDVSGIPNLYTIQEKATAGVPRLVEKLLG